jgi:hypothetical protein
MLSELTAKLYEMQENGVPGIWITWDRFMYIHDILDYINLHFDSSKSIEEYYKFVSLAYQDYKEKEGVSE